MIGMVRTVPHLFIELSVFGLDYSFCRASQQSYAYNFRSLIAQFETTYFTIEQVSKYRNIMIVF